MADADLWKNPPSVDMIKAFAATKVNNDSARTLLESLQEGLQIPQTDPVVISLKGIRSHADLRVLAYIFEHVSIVQSLQLTYIFSDSALIDFVHFICNINVEISRFTIGNCQSVDGRRKEAAKSVGRFVKHCKIKDMTLPRWITSTENWESFVEGSAGAKVLHVIVDKGTMIPEDMYKIGKWCEHVEVDDLRVDGCALTSEHIIHLLDGLGNAKMTSLNLLGNNIPHLTASCTLRLGHFVKQAKLKNLAISRAMGALETRQLVKGCDDVKLETLNLTDCRGIYNNSLLCLLPIVTSHLILGKWTINSTGRRELEAELNKMRPTQLRITTGYGPDIQATLVIYDNAPGSSFESTDSSPEHLEAVLRRRFSTKTTAVKTIGVDGGFIEHAGCKAIFPVKTLEADTVVEASVITDFSDFPEEYLAITPIFECVPGVSEVPNPVSIELESWMRILPDDANIELLFSNESKHSWKKQKGEARYRSDGKIVFETKHFTRFAVVILASLSAVTGAAVGFALRGSTRRHPLRFENYVYIQKSGMLVSVTCFENSKLHKDVIDGLKECGYQSTMLLPEMIEAKSNANLEIKLKCESPNQLVVSAGFDKPTMKELSAVSTINEIVHKLKNCQYFYLQLRDGSLDKYKGRLALSYSVLGISNNVESRPLLIDWPLDNQESASSDAPQSEHAGTSGARPKTKITPSGDEAGESSKNKEQAGSSKGIDQKFDNVKADTFIGRQIIYQVGSGNKDAKKKGDNYEEDLRRAIQMSNKDIDAKEEEEIQKAMMLLYANEHKEDGDLQKAILTSLREEQQKNSKE